MTYQEWCEKAFQDFIKHSRHSYSSIATDIDANPPTPIHSHSDVAATDIMRFTPSPPTPSVVLPPSMPYPTHDASPPPPPAYEEVESGMDGDWPSVDTAPRHADDYEEFVEY